METERSLNRHDTISEFEMERDTYAKEFNSFTPTFIPSQEGKYHNTPQNYLIIILSLFPVYILCGVALWIQVSIALYASKMFSYFCALLLLGYIIFLLVLIFVGASGRLRMEREALEARRLEQIAIKAAEEREKKLAE